MGKSAPDPVAEQTVTSRTELPGWLEPHLQQAANRAAEFMWQGGPGYYPAPTVAPFDPSTTLGMSGISGIASGGLSPMSQDAMQALGATARGSQLKSGPVGGSWLQGGPVGEPYLSGGPVGGDWLTGGPVGDDYMYGGPAFSAAIDAAARQIVPQVQSAFGRAGRNTSGLAQGVAAGEIADRFAGLYDAERNRQVAQYNAERARQAQQYGAERAYQTGLYGAERQRQADAYDAERVRQMQGLALAPTMEQLQYMPSQQLLNVGSIGQTQAQREIDANRARWEHGVYTPQRDLDQYIARITGVSPFTGQTQTQTSPLYRNTGAGILGGGLAGLGIASQLGQMPFFGASGAGAAFAPWLAPVGLLGGLLTGLF